MGTDLKTAKPRKRRSEAAIFSGGHEPFEYLCFRFGYAVDTEDHKTATELAITLLPFLKPKLKQVEANVANNVNIRIRIGGIDDATPPAGELIDDDDDEDEGDA